jgi:hypothetical protein
MQWDDLAPSGKDWEKLENFSQDTQSSQACQASTKWLMVNHI